MNIVYCIVCLKNNKKYIGSSSWSLKKRVKQHFYSCNQNIGGNPLYEDMVKYGEEGFIWGIIEEVENHKERETYWVNKYNTIEEGYNIRNPYGRRNPQYEIKPYGEYKRKNSFKGGEENYNTKLTWEKVREIRRLYSQTSHSYSTLSKLYGVGLTCILKIVRFQTWKE